MEMHIHALDAYRSKASLVHRLDARVKLVLAVGFIVSTALTPDGAWLAYALLAGLALGVIAASRLGAGFVLRRSLVALPFALAAVTVMFTTGGEALLAVRVFGGDLSITDAGLARFVGILLKSWLSVQAAVVLTASTPFPDLLRAMRSLRLPKVLVAVIGFAYRYIFVIADEVTRMMRARAARSGTLSLPKGGTLSVDRRPGGSVFWRARVTGGMAGSLFLRSIERSERIYDAMVARGYDGEVRVLRHPTLQLGDVLVALLFALVLALIQLLARLI
ncbi:MAG: cobalt ECF transporter T component CbiQ [Anaerolineae bacterium]|nr:cobalt ECF transporter T component CbiQ [Anaerolineae bacterium]